MLTEEQPQFSLFETMLWIPEKGFYLREKHIARFLDSAEYFDFPIPSNPRWLSTKVSKPPLPKEIIETYLIKISSGFNSLQRVRLLLDKNGSLTSETKPFQPSDDHPMTVCLANEPVNPGNVFLYYKTTHREVYESACKDAPEYDEDVLFIVEQDELTEFTIGNLVVEIDGKFFTSPISCGLLASTFRDYVLKSGQAKERVLRVNELKVCSKIFLVNSVRGW